MWYLILLLITLDGRFAVDVFPMPFTSKEACQVTAANLIDLAKEEKRIKYYAVECKLVPDERS